MARIKYEDWSPRAQSTLDMINVADAICRDYAAQGYDLTLRQLYYQFVSRDLIPNNQRSYKTLGTVVDRARRAGLLDWNHIVDRTRNLAGFNTYDTPSEFITSQVDRYHIDLWEPQETRVEVWVEKEALAGVVQRAALSRAVDYFSCRGYVSQSEMHAAAQRHRFYERSGQHVVVVHLGDHDPSGIDMTRDIESRLGFFGAGTQVRRIALNFDQIEQYNPPPNPAKLTDSRVDGYIERFGESSWELDALDPATLNQLITDEIDAWMDPELFRTMRGHEDRGRQELRAVANNWVDAVNAAELAEEE